VSVHACYWPSLFKNPKPPNCVIIRSPLAHNFLLLGCVSSYVKNWKVRPNKSLWRGPAQKYRAHLLQVHPLKKKNLLQVQRTRPGGRHAEQQLAASQQRQLSSTACSTCSYYHVSTSELLSDRWANVSWSIDAVRAASATFVTTTTLVVLAFPPGAETTDNCSLGLCHLPLPQVFEQTFDPFDACSLAISAETEHTASLHSLYCRCRRMVCLQHVPLRTEFLHKRWTE
jgi:hypothetical protein